MNKKHGNTGNQNAAKADPATSQVAARVTPRLKAAFVKQAQRDGAKLSQWIVATLAKNCDSDLMGIDQ